MLFDYIKSDLYRYTGKISLKLFIRHYFLNRAFNVCFWFRCASRGNRFVKLVAKLIYKYKSGKTGIIIPAKTEIGYGIFIAHRGPVVISSTAKIGNNFTVYQFSSIGCEEGMAAVIGDNVYIGPNVCIVEKVSIGHNVTIGSGSVVTKDIPDNATAAGNYAKVLHYNKPGRYVYNKWK